jgi:hypothetical protein
MGRVIGFFASDVLYKSLEKLAGESGKSMSEIIREILWLKLFGKEFVLAVSKEDEWIVGKFLLEEFPKALRDYKEKLTGRREDVKVKIYLRSP